MSAKPRCFWMSSFCTSTISGFFQPVYIYTNRDNIHPSMTTIPGEFTAAFPKNQIPPGRRRDPAGIRPSSRNRTNYSAAREHLGGSAFKWRHPPGRQSGCRHLCDAEHLRVTYPQTVCESIWPYPQPCQPSVPSPVEKKTACGPCAWRHGRGLRIKKG